MKKKIAVFGNGWSDEYIRTVLKGVRECAEENNIDVFVFIDFGAGEQDLQHKGETNLVYLPKIEDFDGVMLLANTFNDRWIEEYLHAEVDRVGVPAVSLEYEIPGMDFRGTDNYSGMYELTEHMIKVHDAKDFLFIAGHRDNKESGIRMQAVKDALKFHGLILEEDHILYGEYSDGVVQWLLPTWFDEHKKLPDVIVCANDIMALGACLWLQNRGYDVPKDIAVTGFDCIETARFCYPPISSVERHWDKLGYHSLRHLLDRIEGKPTENYVKMNSRFAVAESCGCRGDNPEATKATVLNSNYGKRREYMGFDSHARALYQKICGVKTAEDLHQALSQFFTGNTAYEGDNLAICMDPTYFNNVSSGLSLLKKGYRDELEMICGTENKVALPKRMFLARELYPGYDGEADGAHVYLFISLHTQQRAMGYVAFKDHDQVLDSYRLYTWGRHLNQYLEQARRNIQLEELNEKLTEMSVTDGLTGVYNRMGYERFALPYLERCRLEGKHSVMMFADINRMKVINDKYGHLQGDLAICTVASALQKAVPKDWIVVRYGGDEFLAAGSCEEYQQVGALKEHIYEVLKQEIEARQICFDLSVSVGDVWVDDEDTLSIEECFKKADASMYEMKKIVHAQQKIEEL